MRSSTTRLMAAIAALLLPACEASETSPMVTLVEAEGYEAAWERYRSAARPAPSGGWIAEGDLHFSSEDDLRTYFDERMLEDVDKAHAIQRDSNGYVPKFAWPAQRNIRYCVSDAFAPNKATWVTRMADAARAWERVANVRFVYSSAFDSACTATQAGVDFAVIRADGGEGYFACSKLLWPEMIGQCPTSGALGVLEIDSNLDVTLGGQLPNLTPTGVLRHELGHILGLRHEHPWRAMVGAPCTETPDFAALDLTGLQLTDVAYDQQSVMHYPFVDCGGQSSSSYTLSKTDVFSIHRLYDMPSSWVDSLNSIALL